MGELIEGRFGRAVPVWLTKQQLAGHPEVRRSPRWLEMRMRDGLPSRIGENGRREFPLIDALDWIANYKAQNPVGGCSGEAPAPRVTPETQTDEPDPDEPDGDQPPDAAA